MPQPSLAMFGSSPRFAEKLHVGRPNIGDKAVYLKHVEEILDRRWLSNGGAFVEQFEARLQDLLGVRHCIAMSNGTIGLQIAIKSLNLQGEVIVPAFTFVATAHALRWVGLDPVFCDVDPQTHQLDPSKVEACITKRTSGILGVHLWGQPCAIEPLSEIAERQGLSLLFDACQALGSSYRGTSIGNFGQLEVFSFHATKFINSFEGGAITTNDDALAAKIRRMKNFGFSAPDMVSELGINGKMNEMCAAMGLTNLEHYDDWKDENRRNFELYQELLQNAPGIRLVSAGNESTEWNHQYVAVELNSRKAGLSRDDLLEVLHIENIMARRYFWPGCHRMEPYASETSPSGLGLLQTERLARQVFVLPSGADLATEQIEQICDTIHTALSFASQIQVQLRKKTPEHRFTAA